MFLAGILLTNGLKFIEPITDALKYGAFVFAFAGFVEGASLASEDMKAQLFNVLKIALVASLAFNFPNIIQEGDNALAQLHTSISERQGALDQADQDAFLQQIKAEATEPSWTDVAGRLTYSIGRCLQKIGWIGYQIVYWIKDISLLLLISVSPLLIGFLAFSYTKSIGVNFLITSLTIVLWNIGFAIVDTLLIILGKIIMPIMGAGAAGIGTAFVVTVGPQFIVTSLVAAVLPIALYFSVPIITGAIMRGSNVAGAVMSGFGMAQQAVYYSGVSNLVSAAAASLENLNKGNSFSSSGPSPSLPSVAQASSGPFMEGKPSASPALGNLGGKESTQLSSPHEQSIGEAAAKNEKALDPQLQLGI